MSDTLEVKIGASDAGLEATLKTVQAELANMEAKVKSGDLTFNELEKTMRRMGQVEGLESKLREMGQAADQTGADFLKATPRIGDLGTEIDNLKSKINLGNLSIDEMKQAVSELSSLKRLEQQIAGVRDEFTKADAPVKQFENVIKNAGDIAMTVDQRLASVSREITDLREHAKTASITVDQFENTMKKIAQLESTEKRLKSMGSEAAEAAPKIDAMGRELQGVGEKAMGIGGFFDESFNKIAGAVSLGNIAASGFNKAVDLAFTAAQSVVQGFGDALDLGGRLTDLSSRTGETSGSLLVLERAFTNTGVSSEAVGTSLNKMQKFMTDAAQGGAAQSEAMQRLGLTMGDLAGKTPTEQMGVFAQRISSIQDPAQRAEAAMSIFGKSGGELLPILNNFSGELEGARDQLGSLPGVMDRSSSAFDAAGDSMAAINSKVMEFAAGFLEEALPALTTFTNALGGIDAAGWGQKAMDTIRSIADTLIGAFKNPLAAIEAWGLAYEAGYKSLGNGLVNAALTFTDFLMKSFETNLPSAITSYVTSGLVDSTLTFSRYLVEALMTFSEGLSTLPGFEGMASKMFDALSTVNEGIIAQQLDNMGKTQAAAAKVVDEFGKAAEKTTVFKEDFFGAEESTARMNEKFTELEESGKTTRENFETTATNAGTANNNIGGAASNSVAVANNFANAASNAAGAETAIENARKASAKVEESWAKITGSGYEAEKSTLGAEAALTRGAREMSNADFSKGFDGVQQNLKDLGGEYEKLANSGAGIKTIASRLGLDGEDKSTKRMLLEVQQEIEKIGKQEVVVDYKFNQELFNASVTSLYDTANSTFANPVPFNVEGDQSIAAVRASAEGSFAAPLALNLDGDRTIQDARAAAETNFSNPITLTMSGSQAANDVYSTVSSAFDAPMTLGLNADTTTAETEVASLVAPQTLSLSANTTTAEQQVASLANPKTVTVDADTTKAQEQLAGLGGGVAVELDAEQSIENIRAQLKDGIELDIAAKSGTSGILETIKGFVEQIKTAVEKIEPKLPQVALAV
jgi:hypothetical protein